MDIETIHESLVNGQRRQMVNQIEEYGDDFWEDYKEYLEAVLNTDAPLGSYTDGNKMAAWEYFTDATISYFRMRGFAGPPTESYTLNGELHPEER